MNYQISNHVLWMIQFTFESILIRQHRHPRLFIRPVKKCNEIQRTHFKQSWDLDWGQSHWRIVKHSGFFQTDANKQESRCWCRAHNGDVGSADLEGAARTRAVAWPAWFWDRWSRKESAGSPSRLAFSGSARTWPGNEAWSSTLNRCSLGNVEKEECHVTCGLPQPTHGPFLCVINAQSNGWEKSNST